MRPFMIFVCVFCLAACQANLPVPSLEAQIAAETEQLIRFSLTDRLARDLETRYQDQFLTMFPVSDASHAQVSGIVTEEFEKVMAVEHQQLLNNLVTVYRRYFTADEIHQLLSFYKTDVARKSIAVSSQIAAESRQYVQLWNEHFGDILMQRVAARLKDAGIDAER